MRRSFTITYYHQSGFSIHIENVWLVFDYWLGENNDLPPELRLRPEIFGADEQVFVFVSHGHPDHFDPVIYTWKDVHPITYILSDDMDREPEGRRMQSGDKLFLSEDVQVTAYPSTDLGVSYYVDVFGVHIFHAGDLNLWHWREESSLKQIEEAEAAFDEAMNVIGTPEVDVCMFPVDPRMGMFFDAGATRFLLSVKPKLFIPMHWQNRPEIASDFARRSRNPKTEVLAITQPGAQAEVTLDGDQLEVKLLEPPTEKQTIAADVNQKVNLDAYQSDDPFSDSDLPVNLNK